MSHRFQSLEEKTADEWKAFEKKWQERFAKKPSVEAIIFLIGIQEGDLHKEEYSKEDKKDIMHIGVCNLLMQEGYYELSHRDEDNWPHYKKLKEFEHINLENQEQILQKNILTYFKSFL